MNRLYREEPALWEADVEPPGFEWLDADAADDNMIAFMRIAPASGRTIVCVCNFSPVLRRGFRVGVPRAGWYREILNTDAAVYGGGNRGNLEGLSRSPFRIGASVIPSQSSSLPSACYGLRRPTLVKLNPPRWRPARGIRMAEPPLKGEARTRITQRASSARSWSGTALGAGRRTAGLPRDGFTDLIAVLMVIATGFSAFATWRPAQATSLLFASADRPFLGVSKLEFEATDTSDPHLTVVYKNFGRIPAVGEA